MDRYKKELKKLNDQQRDATQAIEGPVLVLAGPGTGKTQLLSTRAAYILQNTQVEPQNILCLTFTETAAFTMKQRMVNIIGERAYKIPTSTYHSFGKDLLMSYPHYFPNLVSGRPLDELSQYSIVEQIIEDLPYSDPLKKSLYYVKDVVSTISDLKSALISPEKLRKIASNNQRFESEANKHIKKTLSGIARISKKSIENFAKLQTSITSDKKLSNPDAKSLATLFLSELDQAIIEAGASNTKPITKWKNDWLERGEDGEFVINGKTANDKILSLAKVYQAYGQALEAENQFDYDDMILMAIDGMENNPDFRYSLQEKYQYLMLDEFQDTNASQMKLVELLTDNPIYEGKPNIMAVGDDNQAIYAFQGADYSNIVRFRTIFKDTKTIALTDNYRSHQSILKSAATLSDQVQTSLPGSNNRKLFAKAKITSSEVERLEFKTDVAQFAWVTKKITKLIKKGLNPKKIAVIAPKHSLIEPLVAYLRRAEIPVFYEKRENLLNDPQIIQIISAAKLVLAIAERDRTLANQLWPEVLSYDYWQINVDDIWNLSNQAYSSKNNWSETLSANKKTKPIFSFFVSLAAIAKTESLETMLDYLTGVDGLTAGSSSNTKLQSPFYEYHFGHIDHKSSNSDFWNLLSNLTVLRQKLRDRQANSNQVLKLPDFIDFVQMHEKAEIKILNTNPYAEQEDSVQLLTAFAAKGLEFDTVFMIAAIDEAWGPKTSTKSNNVPLPKNLKHIRYSGADDDERLRLLYVAVTRAERNLYITSYRSNYANKPTSRIRYFNEREDGDRLVSDILPSSKNSIISEDFAPPKIEELRSYWGSRHLDSLKNAKLAAILKPKLDQYQLAPTHLNSFTDVIYSGPEKFFLNTILRFPQAPSPEGQYGNAFHETIYYAHTQLKKTGKLPTSKELVSEFSKNLKSMPMAEHTKLQLLTRGRSAIEEYFKKARDEFSETNEHELNFKKQGVIVGSAHLTGKIDKLIIDKKKRSITIVDFKTGSSHDKWSPSNPKLHKYRQQLYMYKMLVEGSYQFDGYSVEGAYLEFVEAKTNNSRKLHLVFDQDEQQKLKDLINAVWANIKRLDFPSIENYPKNIKGVKMLEQDLIEKNRPS